MYKTISNGKYPVKVGRGKRGDYGADYMSTLEMCVDYRDLVYPNKGWEKEEMMFSNAWTVLAEIWQPWLVTINLQHIKSKTAKSSC